MSFTNLPSTLSALLYKQSTKKSIIAPNNKIGFVQIVPLQIQQSVTTQTSEMDLVADINTAKTDISISNVFLDFEEKVLFKEKGYSKIRKICNTLQGELIEAIQKTERSERYVMIKKCDKILAEQHVSYTDDDGMNFCIDDSIKKEELILKYLTINNKPTADYIVKYIDFFESNTDYYLVTESMYNNNNQMNLKQFTERAHKYIKIGKLEIKHYHKIIKYIFWQLISVIHWLHKDMNCCHLNLCLENIILNNAEFIQNADGLVTINQSIIVKLSDFSQSEVFKYNDKNFHCMKYSLFSDVQYLSPNAYNGQIFDARCADIWALGMILYNTIVGKPIYDTINIYELNEAKRGVQGTGYWAVMTNNIKAFIYANNLQKYFNVKILSIINCLLEPDHTKRIKAVEMLQHPWFKLYFQKYQQRIQKKSAIQKQQLQQQQQEMKNFPFYVR